MNQPASVPPSVISRRTSRWVVGLRIAGAVLVSVVIAAVLWTELVLMPPHRAAEDVENLLRSLAWRRPANMTPREWGCAVAWTGNLHGNSLIDFETDAKQIRALEKRIAERLSGEVDLSTIHWIWDEYAKICPHGAQYQRFRENMMEDIRNPNASWTIDVR